MQEFVQVRDAKITPLAAAIAEAIDTQIRAENADALASLEQGGADYSSSATLTSDRQTTIASAVEEQTATTMR